MPVCIRKKSGKPRRCVFYFVLIAVNRKSLFGRKEISKLQFTVSKRLISITETVLSAPLEQQVSIRSRSYFLSLFNGKNDNKTFLFTGVTAGIIRL